MAEFASRGVGAGGLTTGIIGTSLGVLNSGMLGNLFGGARNACPEEHIYSRYDASKDARIAELETEVKLRDANTFTLGEMDKLRNYIDVRIGAVERELADQRVYNATNIATVNCINNQVAQLMALTKLVVPIASICPTPAVAATT
jgi:hypothetical protein